jgi:hypothetical protein
MIKIYKNYKEFCQREDKTINGVSQEFLDAHSFTKTSEFLDDDLVTGLKLVEIILVKCTRCWNCSGCYDCKNCINCINCFWSTNCKNCKDCVRCSVCKNCKDCFLCEHCVNCGDRSYASYCYWNIDPETVMLGIKIYGTVALLTLDAFIGINHTN